MEKRWSFTALGLAAVVIITILVFHNMYNDAGSVETQVRSIAGTHWSDWPFQLRWTVSNSSRLDSQPRLLCWVLTSPLTQNTKARAVMDTWGSQYVCFSGYQKPLNQW